MGLRVKGEGSAFGEDGRVSRLGGRAKAEKADWKKELRLRAASSKNVKVEEFSWRIANLIVLIIQVSQLPST